MHSEIVDPMVDVTISGTPDEVARQVDVINHLLRAAEYREHLAEHPHDGLELRGTVARSGFTPGQAGEIQFASWVPESRIPPAHVAFVRRHVDRAARELHLPRLRIRWFGPPVGDGDFWMVCPYDDGMPSGVAPESEPGTVAFNRDLRGPALVGVIAHEVRHCAQLIARQALSDKTWMERDADGFAAEYVVTVEP